VNRDKAGPVLLTPLDRARAAALAELKASKGFDIVSHLVASESVLTQARRQALAEKQGREGEHDRSHASLPALAPETGPESTSTKPPSGAALRKKKRGHKKSKAWKDHPFATPKEALISLSGGVYVPPTAATPERLVTVYLLRPVDSCSHVMRFAQFHTQAARKSTSAWWCTREDGPVRQWKCRATSRRRCFRWVGSR
jgi:hypothetical protein